MAEAWVHPSAVVWNCDSSMLKQAGENSILACRSQSVFVIKAGVSTVYACPCAAATDPFIFICKQGGCQALKLHDGIMTADHHFTIHLLLIMQYLACGI